MQRTRRSLLTAFGVGTAGIAVGTTALGDGGGRARAGGGAWPQRGADAGNTGAVAERGPRDGRELWRREARSGDGTPLVGDGLVFPPRGAAPVDAATGERRWDRTTDTGADGGLGYEVLGAVADGTVLLAGGETLYGLDIADGSRRWTHALPGGRAAVTVADDTAYVWTGANTQSVIIALRARDGTFRWRYRTAPGGGVPAVVDGTLYLSLKGRLAALDAETGEERWSYSVPPVESGASGGAEEPAVARSPVVADGSVYAVDSAGRLHALSAGDGEEQWRFAPDDRPPAGPGESPAGTRPVVADGDVYAGFSDGRVRAFDAGTGERRWSFRAWNSVTGAPALTEDTLYIGGRDTMVYALDRATGRRRWEFSTRSVVRGVAVAGGRAYAGTRYGVVHALGPGGDA